MKSSIVRGHELLFWKIGKFMEFHWPRPRCEENTCQEFVENHYPMETMKETQMQEMRTRKMM